MESKKVPISFNEKDLKEIQELSDFFGFGSVEGGYGVLPKVIKTNMIFVKSFFNNLEKVIPDLEEGKLDLLFATIKKIKLEKYKMLELKVLEKKQEELKKGITLKP